MTEFEVIDRLIDGGEQFELGEIEYIHVDSNVGPSKWGRLKCAHEPSDTETYVVYGTKTESGETVDVPTGATVIGADSRDRTECRLVTLVPKSAYGGDG